MADGTDSPGLHIGKTVDGDVIRRPGSSSQQLVPVVFSPARAYHKDSTMWSPIHSHPFMPSADATSQQSIFSNEDLTRQNAGLRRRPSIPPPAPPVRRYSGGDYDHKLSFTSDAGRGLRSREDPFYASDREREPSRNRGRDDYSHPDYHYERSRPPRTLRNIAGWESAPSGPPKSYFDDSSRSDLEKNRDLEKGMREPGSEFQWASGEKIRRKSSDESIDGYNYAAHKRNSAKATFDFQNLSPEERAIVLRLPWTAWMNSDFKNREFNSSSVLFSKSLVKQIPTMNDRLRSNRR